MSAFYKNPPQQGSKEINSQFFFKMEENNREKVNAQMKILNDSRKKQIQLQQNDVLIKNLDEINAIREFKGQEKLTAEYDTQGITVKGMEYFKQSTGYANFESLPDPYHIPTPPPTPEPSKKVTFSVETPKVEVTPIIAPEFQRIKEHLSWKPSKLTAFEVAEKTTEENTVIKLSKKEQRFLFGRSKGLMSPSKGRDKKVKDYVSKPGFETVSIPTSYDWRSITGTDGQPILIGVQDQGDCGSCYAFSSVGSLQSNISIATQGSTKQILSPQDMVNCGPSFINDVVLNPAYASELKALQDSNTIPIADVYALQGCDGGLLVSAALYLVMVGVPLQSVEPYKAKQIACNSGAITRFIGASSSDLTIGAEDGFPPYDVPMSQVVIDANVQNMQLSILENGPIYAGFNVYTDFLYYPTFGQIYIKQNTITVNNQTVSVQYEGSHAIQIIGWNVSSSGVPYWICQNQWGTSWGINGYFYIRRGTNEANIELDAIEIKVDPSKLSAVGSKYQLNSTNSAASDWWVWFLVAISAAVVVIVIVIVSVVATRHKNKNKAKSEKNDQIDF